MQGQYTLKCRIATAALDLPAEIHPVVKRVYSARAISNPQETRLGLDCLLPLEHLSGLSSAVRILADALAQQQRIVIVGDFDADGATSSALSVRALRAMGAKHVDFLVPNRFEYGYGLTPEIVAVAAQMQPDVIMTVDNGIASIDGVAAAQRLGVRVIITDHHLPGEQLPAADAIVNPNLTGDTFPSKHLAGVGVVFYVMLGLRAALRATDWFQQQRIAEPNMAQYLDLVALGTVADLVVLDHNNRILVEQGLRRIRANQCVPGIQALLAIGKRSAARCVASDLGFVVAPRLNAAGRLEDMSLGIACLLTEDLAQAQQLAQQLDELNQQRRVIERDMQSQAMSALQTVNQRLKLDDLPAGVCLYDPRWHQGVIGILAARIKDQVHRPVIAFANVSATELKGSARSIGGCHIRDVLAAIATQYPQLIHRFGGHAMAAGVSLSLENLPTFKAAFAEQVARQLQQPLGEAVLLTDGELAADELDLATAEALRNAGPWGQGFPEPLFEGIFRLCDKRVVGAAHLKMRIQPLGAEIELDAIAFNRTDESLDASVEQLRIAYHLDINEYQGRRQLQCNVRYFEPVV